MWNVEPIDCDNSFDHFEFKFNTFFYRFEKIKTATEKLISLGLLKQLSDIYTSEKYLKILSAVYSIFLKKWNQR